MKKAQISRGMAVAVATLLVTACATQTAGVADTRMEQALVTAGFRVKTATTAAQLEQIRTLPDNRFERVRQGGNTYYLYADKRENRLYAGDRYAYRAYQAYVKNNRLRAQGAFVWELNPTDRANNRTIQEWHGWAPFPEW